MRDSTDVAFPQSWASLIDESALAGLPDSERKRQEACYELIATEQSYVQSLQLVIEVRFPAAVFASAHLILTAHVAQVFLNALQPVLPEKALRVIFANIDDILLFNTVRLGPACRGVQLLTLSFRRSSCRSWRSASASPVSTSAPSATSSRNT